jgi:hypothetical protein
MRFSHPFPNQAIDTHELRHYGGTMTSEERDPDDDLR